MPVLCDRPVGESDPYLRRRGTGEFSKKGASASTRQEHTIEMSVDRKCPIQGLLSVHSVAACTLALSPIRDTLIEGFSHFVTSMTAPIAPAGAVAGQGLHPLENAAFSRRTPLADNLYFSRSVAGGFLRARCSLLATRRDLTTAADNSSDRRADA